MKSIKFLKEFDLIRIDSLFRTFSWVQVDAACTTPVRNSDIVQGIEISIDHSALHIRCKIIRT